MLKRPRPDPEYVAQPDYITGFDSVGDNRQNSNNPRSTRLAALAMVLTVAAGAFNADAAISKAEGTTSPAPVAVGPQIAGGDFPEAPGDCSDCVYPGPSNRYGGTWVLGASGVFGEGAWVNIHALQGGRPYRGVLAIELPTLAPGTIEFVSPQMEHGRPTDDYQTKLTIGAEAIQVGMARDPASAESVTGAYSRPESVNVVLGAPNLITVDVPASLAS